MSFKNKDQKHLGTLLIFTPISLAPKKCGLSISSRKNKRVYLGVMKFKNKDKKYLKTLLIFTQIPLKPKKCGLSISSREIKRREWLTLTYIPFHSTIVCLKILYVSPFISN